MTTDPPGSNKPPARNAPEGQPKQSRPSGIPGIKKGPQGWQLPLDPAMRAEPRRPSKQKPAPANRSASFVLLFGILMLAVLAGCLLYWRDSVKAVLHKRPLRTEAETSRLLPCPAVKSLPPASQTLPAIVSVIASSGKSVRYPTVVSVAIASKPVLVAQATSAVPTPIIPASPAPVSEAEAFHQTLAEYNLIFGGKPRPLNHESDVETLYNRAYAVGYSNARREALWVGYRLDKTSPGGALPRPKKFVSDDRLPFRVKPKEYTHSGFDRGHLAPNSAIARRFGAEAQLETFLMSNIAPQRPALNRNVWQRLERLEDSYANIFDQVYIITGPIFDSQRETLSDSSDVEIPDEFYKILLDEDDGRIHMLAFRIPQTVSGQESLEQFLTSVDEIEQATGFDFFWALSDPLEQHLEAIQPLELWEESRDVTSLASQME